MRAIKSQQGMTLIELVIAMIVMSIIAVPISSYLSSSVQAYLATKDNINGINEMRYAMDRLALELRDIDNNGAGYNLVTNPLNTAAANTRFEFANTSGSNIVIEYTAGELRLTDGSISAAAYTLANNVTAFDFNYYQMNDALPASDGTNLAFVEFEMTLQEGGVSYTSRSRVSMRDKRL